MGSIARKLLALLASIGAVVLVGQTAWAAAPVTATGPFEARGADAELIKVADGNIFVHLTIRAQLHGVVEGFRVADAITILHPDGLFTASGTAICSCLVAGRSGTYTERFDASGITGVSVDLHFTVISGTEGLSNLHAVGTFSGPPGGNGTYSISFHFDP